MKYPDRFKRGVVLVTVIIFVLILSILAVTILFIMTNEARHTEAQIRRIRAHYAAQAGIQHYLELLKTNPAPGQVDIDVDGIPVTTNLQPGLPPPCPSGESNVDCIKSDAAY
jgi:type II secretory pathway component PulK